MSDINSSPTSSSDNSSNANQEEGIRENLERGSEGNDWTWKSDGRLSREDIFRTHRGQESCEFSIWVIPKHLSPWLVELGVWWIMKKRTKVYLIKKHPMGGNYLAICLFGFIFSIRPLNSTELNHERIHAAQQKELFYLPFFIWYGI